jgi:hypothetical protein
MIWAGYVTDMGEKKAVREVWWEYLKGRNL